MKLSWQFDQLPPLDAPYSPTLLLLTPIVLALATHAGTQLHEPRSRPFVGISFAVLASLTYWVHTHWNIPLRAAAAVAAGFAGVYIVSISISIAIYRLFFHRIRRFPGPLSLALSKWSMVIPDLQGCRPVMFQELHRQYGDVIRTGPRELSVSDPAAISSIYGASGPAARCTRGPWYSFTVESTHAGEVNLQSTPTMTDHAARRKVWDSAFNMKAVKGYEDVIRLSTQAVVTQLHKHQQQGRPLDWGSFTAWFGFDMMGDIGWGKNFGMVESAQMAKPIALIESAVFMIMALGNVPYAMALTKELPSPVRLFESWIHQTLRNRIEKGPANNVKQDVIGHLVETTQAQGEAINFGALSSDAGLLVVAGADTSSTSMALLMFELVCQQHLYARLQTEIDSVFGKNDAEDFNVLQKDCPFLNACITETLRLHAPVPSGLQRVTPDEGLVISLSDGSKMPIPPHTVISTHTWVIHRDPRNFSRPEEFVPDRWIKPEDQETHNAKAWVPFGYGPTSCIGRQVALMEMRILIARFVQNFDATFPSSFDPEKLRASIKDWFVVAKDPIWLSLTPREKGCRCA